MENNTLDNTDISRHLGKASEYKTQYDASLLVRETRKINRENIGIYSKLPFVGSDTWNVYEASALTDNGLPVTSIIKIIYPADNNWIVESKSLKLYFNSFNMTKIGSDAKSVNDKICELASKDLSELLETNVSVTGFNPTSINTTTYQQPEYNVLEDIENVDSIKFDQYAEDDSILQSIESIGEQRFQSSLLRSNCKITKQPDNGTIYIHIIPNEKSIQAASLLKYIVSYRNECHFHESIIESVYYKLWNKLQPKELLVKGLYVRRGGIDIVPQRASSEFMLDKDLIDPIKPYVKTSRQ